MAFGSFDSKASSSAMSEINMIPLIDVMLVLLVIFIITAPLLSHTIRINVPQVSAQPADQKPKIVDLAIDANGALYWNDQPTTVQDLASQFASEAVQDPQPEIHIRADTDTHYGLLAEVMAAARRAGMKRLGFVTQPGQTPAAGAAGAGAGAPSGQAPAGGHAAAPAASGARPQPGGAPSTAPAAPAPAPSAPAAPAAAH